MSGWRIQVFARPSQRFCETGEKGHLFHGNREQRPHLEGSRGTKTIFGNREYKKTLFYFLGNKLIYVFQGNKGTVTPVRASFITQFL